MSEGRHVRVSLREELMRFTEAEGADRHCAVAAQSLRDERVFEWLEDILRG